MTDINRLTQAEEFRDDMQVPVYDPVNRQPRKISGRQWRDVLEVGVQQATTDGIAAVQAATTSGTSAVQAATAQGVQDVGNSTATAAAIAAAFGDVDAAISAATAQAVIATTKAGEAGAASVQADAARVAADAARVAAEAARDSANTSARAYTSAEGTAPALADGTISTGQTFAVVAADLQSYAVYRKDAGPVATLMYVQHTKAYIDSLTGRTSSEFPYLLAFTAPDSSGNDRVLGGFDKNGRFDAGPVRDLSGKVAQLSTTLTESPATNSSWLLPFVAQDSSGNDRVLGGFDAQGRLNAGRKHVIKEGDYAFEYIGPTSAITCWGDSLTEGSGGTPYPEQLGTLLGVTVTNRGYGGQNAEKIVSRQGGYCALLTVSGNQIPTSGAVAVTMGTAILSYPSAVSKSITGSIRTFSGDIAGTLTKDAAGAYTFTRTVSGTAATVLPNTPFCADPEGSDFAVNVLWAGANDVGTASISTVGSFVDRFVESIKTAEKRFVILAPIADVSFTSGTAGYTNMRATIDALKLRYPRNFIDVQERLVESFNAGIPQDVTDHTNKVTPSSLRADSIHLNTAGYALVAGWVHQFLKDKGWA